MSQIFFILLLILYGVLSSDQAFAQEGEDVHLRVLSPLPGQPLQGTVEILAELPGEEVASLELLFSYTGDRTKTWFFITELQPPITGKKLADWDTTTLTDGNYILRLVIFNNEGSRITEDIEGLRIRNYTPVETPTPTASATPAPKDTPIPTLTLTPTLTFIPPTGTPLPTNPAQVSIEDVPHNLGRGAIGAAAFFLLMGLYALIRHVIRS
jgi:hypothetical protein